MHIQEVIKIISQMEAQGVIERYAIGGAVGATFYLEPVATLDVDIFVSFKAQSGSLILSLQPIFDYLKVHGGVLEGEHVMVAGWPVQILPSNTTLVEEALAQAVEKDVVGTIARVFTPEHLAAIALQTGRAKDKARLLSFVESGVLDSERLQAILVRHNLVTAWGKFQERFLDD